MLRYAPFALIWAVGLPFVVWLLIAPRVADPRYWQVDAVDITLGSTQVFNPVDTAISADQKPNLNNAAKSAALSPPPKSDVPGFTPPPALTSDGIKINAQNPDLQEDSDHGLLPKIAADGRAPWQYYARPFPADDKRPRLAIIIKDMGLSQSAVQDSITALPGTVTFAFSPYADDLAKAMQSTRDAGHETMLELPLEIPPGSTVDTGTFTISTSQTSAVNQDNFLKLLSRMLGCVGVITDGGQQLVNNENMLRPLMQNLLVRGLLLVDDTQQNETLSPLIAEQLKAPWARSLFSIDATLSQDAMDVAMSKAVEAAKQNGRAVVVASASPLTRSVVANWAHRIDREGTVVLVPITAVTTLGSATQLAVIPATSPVVGTSSAPGVMQPPQDAESPTMDDNAAAPGGSVNLLNPKTPDGAPAPSILDPSKPVTQLPQTTGLSQPPSHAN